MPLAPNLSIPRTARMYFPANSLPSFTFGLLYSSPSFFLPFHTVGGVYWCPILVGMRIVIAIELRLKVIEIEIVGGRLKQIHATLDGLALRVLEPVG